MNKELEPYKLARQIYRIRIVDTTRTIVSELLRNTHNKPNSTPFEAWLDLSENYELLKKLIDLSMYEGTLNPSSPLNHQLITSRERGFFGISTERILPFGVLTDVQMGHVVPSAGINISGNTNAIVFFARQGVLENNAKDALNVFGQVIDGHLTDIGLPKLNVDLLQ